MGILTELFSWLILIVLLSWIVSGAWAVSKKLVEKLVPSLQIHTMMLVVVTPVVVATMTLWFYQFPAFSDWLVNSHCHDGDCRPHLLYLPASLSFSHILLVAGAIGIATAILIIIRTVRLNARYTRALKSFSRRAPESLYRVVDSEQISAWCAGFFSPQVYVTKGLTESASKDELHLIVLHELNHVRRLDNLKRAVATILMCCWIPALRRAFSSQLANALEIRSDLYAMKTANVKDVEKLPVDLCARDAITSIQSEGRRAILGALLSRPDASIYSAAIVYLAMVAWVLVLFVFTVRLAHPLLEYLLR